VNFQANLSNSQEWKDCLEYMAHRVKEQSFNTWLKPTKGQPTGNGDFKLAVPNQFVADWIDGHFRNVIEEAFREVLGGDYLLDYVISENLDPDQQVKMEFSTAQPVPQLQVKPAEQFNHNLSVRYQFDSLVVGDFNQFACAASMAVADAPGTTRYNPLFIYGGTGLGKTHIVQAIGHRILDLFPNKRVMYATSEKFTSDLRGIRFRFHEGLSRCRCPDNRRHPVLHRQRVNPGAVLSYFQHSLPLRQADNPDLGPPNPRDQRS